MRAERINQDQVRFTLSEADLVERNLKISELAYGTDKTKALFDDMMKTAQDQFGMDFSNKPMMIEAIPISGNELMITVTRVSGAAEMGAMFGTNLPMAQDARPEELSRPNASGKSQGAEKSRQTEGQKISETIEIGVFPEDGSAVIYEFGSFETLCRVASHVPAKLNLKNELYHEDDGTYYLVCYYSGKATASVRYLVSMLSQFADDWYMGKQPELLVKEHAKKIIGARALQKLAVVEGTSENN